MAGKEKSKLRLEIAHVLFIDIVGYSKLLIDQQSAVLRELNDVVSRTQEFREAESENKLIRLPTGDGMALVFRTTPDAPARCAIEIGQVLKNHPRIQLRMGVHSGPVNEIADVNQRTNIAGSGINIAQRVMDCGDAGHILVSKRVADDLEQYDQWRPLLHDLGSCEVKHGVRVGVANLYCEEVGNSRLPKKVAAFRKRRLFRWAMALTALLLLALIVGGFVLSSKRSRLSTGNVLEKSIAVLPFENLSHDPDNAYFADGIQEEILTRLTRIADLKVISRTSTQQFQSKPGNLPEIAKRLGAGSILEGTVQKVADQVRVNVQLLNATNDSHLWAEKYDRKLTDIFAVESEIASRIAETLQAKLSDSEEKAIAVRPTRDSDAHQLYLKGRYFWGKQTGTDLEKAIDYFNQAIAKDANYAAAYAGLSDCYAVLFFWMANPGPVTRADYLEKSKIAAERALQIDSTLGEAHASLARALFLAEFKLNDAKREFELALARNPNDASARFGFGSTVLPALGELDRAVAEIKRAVELDPFSPIINAGLGYLYMMARKYPEAIAQDRKTIELNPDYYLSHQNLAQALELSGQVDEAIAEYERPHGPSHEPYVLAFRAHVYGSKGEREKSAQLLNEMKEMNKQRAVWPFGFALAYLGLGDKEEAINWLERSDQAGEYEMLAFLKLHPMLDPLRGEARFEQLVEKVFGGAIKSSSPSPTRSRSIAVLPFENLSPDPDNAYFADGIQEEILTRLSKIADLKVISRTSTQRYKSNPDNLRAIADQLGVTNVLEGTVQKAGEKVRVNVQLINATADTHLWADTYDRKFTDVFALESEIAARIADTLKARLTGTEQQAITARPTDNKEAHELYLRGRYYWNKKTADSLAKAIDYFTQAIQRDRSYALAYAGLADSYVALPLNSDTPAYEAMPKAKAAVLKALAIDSALPEGHAALALVKAFYEWDWSGGEKEIQQAIQLNPNEGTYHHRYGMLLSAVGRNAEAIAEVRRAQELDPLSLIITTALAACLEHARKYDEGIAECRKVFEIDPNFWVAHHFLGGLYEQKGLHDQALEELKKARTFPGAPAEPLSVTGYVYAVSGRKPEALKVIAELKQSATTRYIPPYHFAMVYGGLGDKDRAFDLLEQSFRNRDNVLGFGIKAEPRWDNLRSDPRYADLLKRMNLAR
jgi:TolB-like protein/Flp pilus assembly protein TadD/class 3 adenylate cyclase